VLDLRVYRAAFLPALVTLFVVAFSLADRPSPRTTRLASAAFNDARAFGEGDSPQRNSLRELAQSFPRRRPGSAADARLADRVAERFVSSRFAAPDAVRRVSLDGETPQGVAQLEDVVAVREGLSSRTIVIVAHRDARGSGAEAELSGTAALLEFARLLADRDLPKSVVLASVSGGSGGFAGARELEKIVPGPVDGVIVLGDLASVRDRRPWVVAWANGRGPAPHAFRRTVEVALRQEIGTDGGRDRAIVQWARRALPLTATEQGEVDLPAVLVSGTSERLPPARARISQRRFAGFGRGVLRALTAALGPFDAGPVAAARRTFAGGDGIIVVKRLVPGWAIRLLVAALLLPALVTAIDAFFRARRRGLAMGRWLLWVGAWAVPFLLAWGWARALDLVGAVRALPAPAVSGTVPLTSSGALAMASTALVLALGLFALRPALARRTGARGSAAAGGAAAATSLVLVAVAGVVWLGNPYAAAVLLGAAHLWLLATAPGSRLRGVLGTAAVVGGLLLPFAVIFVYVSAWGLGPAEGLWTAFGLVSGGVLGWGAAIALSLLAGLLCATIAILLAGRRVAAVAPEERVTTRGPRSYAGPGSLGGTESALRR
jgi:hypothetical protein